MHVPLLDHDIWMTISVYNSNPTVFTLVGIGILHAENRAAFCIKRSDSNSNRKLLIKKPNSLHSYSERIVT